MPKEENGRVPIQGEDGDEPLIIPGPHYYSLPRVRYVNIFITVILLEGLVSCILWLSGGDSEYFISSIADFSLKTSVFDIVLLSIVDVLFIALLLLPTLEKESYKKISEHHRNSTADKLLLFLLIFVCLAFFVFSCVKGGLILHCIQHDDSYTTMHGTYNGLVIVFCVFSFVKLCQALFGFFALRRLKKIRILHRFDEKGQEIDKDGIPLKKKVDLKRLFSLAIPEVGFLSLGCFTLLFSSAAQIVTPLYFGQVVDAAQKSLHDLVQKVLILLVVNLIGSVFAFVRSWVFTQAGMRLVARLRKKLFASIIEQEIAFFDSNRTGELCNRLSSDTQVLQNAVTVNVSMLFRYALQLIGSLGFMFYLNASLTGVLLAVVPIISVSAVVYGKYLRNYRQKFQDKLGEAGTMAEENISSIRTVRMFSAEAKARQLYDVEIDGSYKIGIKLSFLLGTFTGVIGVVMQGAICLALWYGGKLVYENLHGSHNGLTPGILTSFLLYTLQVAMAFSFMTSLYGDFMQAVGASIRIFHLLDRKPEVPNENGIILPGFKGDISFNEVQFTYPTRPETQVLKGVSFSLQPGEMLALVGPSGGGKSTIVNLLERFYDPEEGSIRLDDTDLKDLDPKWFRQRIAMVSQEPTLFCCSIRDNIAFGRTASDEEVIVAAKKANAHDFIIGFEKGYDTLVGERGVRLSGGQKQRIAIARALIMNPAVLLLDEATSALDAESEHLVQEAVDSAMKNRTVIVIAHRLSTVRNATKVIVIDKGKIAEEGTHEELLSRNGVYKRLVLRQLTAGTLATETSPNDDQNDNQNVD